MQKVKLGTTGLEVSALAMGSDVLGSKLDKETSFRLLDFYFESGGNLIDTANFYASWIPGFQGGESEQVIGEWLHERGNRNKICIGSKLGFDYPASQGGLSAVEIERECDRSLKRLGTDHLDIYYSHRDDPDTSLEESMGAFDRLVKAGKIRAIGASNLSVWRIAEANTIARLNNLTPYSVIEQRYTYLRPRHGADFGPQIFLSEDLKAFAKAHQIGLVGYSVLLSGAYSRSERSVPAQFAGPDSDARMLALNDVAAEVGMSANQVLIAWLRQSDPAILPIVAGSKIEQFRENIDALKLRLSDEQMQKLSTAGNPFIKEAWLQPT